MATAPRPTLEVQNSKALGLSAELILEGISDAFVALDAEWRFTYFNAAAERLNGTSRHEVLGHSHWEVYPESLGTTVERHLRQVMETRAPVRFENYYEPWQRWFEVHAFPLATGGIGFDYREISERKQAEAQLQRIVAADAKFRAMFEQGLQFAGILSLDGRVLEANRSCLEAAGVDRDEVIGRPFWECVWWNSFPELREMVRRACAMAAAGKSFRTDSTYVAAKGEVRFVDLMVAPVTDDDGKVIFLAATGTDITDRKRAERRNQFLKEVAEATQPLIDPNAMTAVVARLLADELQVNRCAYSVVEDETTFVITGDYCRGVPSIVGRWPVAAFGDACLDAMLANEPYVVRDAEHDPRIRPDNLPAFHATAIQSGICVPLHKAGRFTAAMAVHQSSPRNWTDAEIDLVRTVVGNCWESLERTRTLARLRLSEERFKAAASATSEIIWTNDASGQMPVDQPGWGAFTGQSPEEYVGYGWSRAVHPEDAQPTIEAWNNAVAERRTFVFEHRVRRRDGVYRHFSIRAVPIADDQGEIREWVGTHTDITELKRVEQELRSAQDRLDAALDAGTIGIWNWDVVRDRMIADRNFATMFGLDPADAARGVPLQSCLEAIHPDDRTRVAELIKNALFGQERYDADYRLLTPGAEIRWVEVRGRVIRDAYGRPASFPGVVADITDRKRAELELARVSEESDRVRRLYETVLSNMVDLAYVFDLNHRFIYANAVLLKMWGRTWDEAIGKNCLELGYEPWHAEMHDREIEQVKATKQPIRGEVPFHGTFGRRIYDYIFVPILNAAGEVEAIAGTTRDVTDRKLYEEELQQSERRFRELADASPAMLWLTDASGDCTFLSSRWYEYTGQTVDEALGLGWTTATHPDDADEVGREFMAASNEQRSFSIEYRLRRRDGEYCWAMDLGRPRFSAAGEFLGLVGIVIEIDDRKRAEDALKLADRRKDEFLATLAHELRNPLAPISNALEVWPLLEPGTEEADELRGMMQRQLRQMIRLIDDLLDVSRITRGKVELRTEPLDLATVVEGAIEAIRPFIAACRHELSVLLPSQPVKLEGDVGRLMQVFGNLLHNAAKYTGQSGHLWVTVKAESDQAIVSVRDDGPGIPPEMLTGIFEMFQQVDQTLDRAHGGLGIGLTLAKTLVEMHGGTIEARSDGPGRGSEFTVSLPLESSSQHSEESRGGFTLKQHLRPQTLRALVVDDVVPSAKTLAMMLGGLEQKTCIEHDGPAALSAVETFQPDIVFLDIAMPGMDGYEVARRIRASGGRQPVLVALTGYGQEEDRQRAVAAGFDHHLVKPTSVDHLREVLMTVPSPVAK